MTTPTPKDGGAARVIHAPDYPDQHKAVCGDATAMAFAGLVYVTCAACLAPHGMMPPSSAERWPMDACAECGMSWRSHADSKAFGCPFVSDVGLRQRNEGAR